MKYFDNSNLIISRQHMIANTQIKVVFIDTIIFNIYSFIQIIVLYKVYSLKYLIQLICINV